MRFMAPIPLNRLGPPAEDGLAEPTSPEVAAPTTAPLAALHATGQAHRRPDSPEGHESERAGRQRYSGERPVAARGHAPDPALAPGREGDRPVAVERDAAEGTPVRLPARAGRRPPALADDPGADQRQTGRRLLEGSGWSVAPV